MEFWFMVVFLVSAMAGISQVRAAASVTGTRPSLIMSGVSIDYTTVDTRRSLFAECSWALWKSCLTHSVFLKVMVDHFELHEEAQTDMQKAVKQDGELKSLLHDATKVCGIRDAFNQVCEANNRLMTKFERTYPHIHALRPLRSVLNHLTGSVQRRRGRDRMYVGATPSPRMSPREKISAILVKCQHMFEKLCTTACSENGVRYDQ